MNFIELRTEIFIFHLKRLWSVFEQYTSDQSNDIHEASCRWLGYIGMKRGGSFRTTHGFGRSRNWTSFSILGLLIKKCLLNPFSCERFLQVIPQGSYYWRLMWNPPHLLLSSDKRKGLKYLSLLIFFLEIDIQIYKLIPSKNKIIWT